MFFKKKAKAEIRRKIISTYLDNYLKLDNGTSGDEWGNNWVEKSYNDVMKYFKETKKMSNFDIVAMQWAFKINEDYIYAPLNALHQIYFGKEASEEEINLLRFEFKEEKKFRKIEITVS